MVERIRSASRVVSHTFVWVFLGVLLSCGAEKKQQELATSCPANACADNTSCRVENDQAVCECLAGYQSDDPAEQDCVDIDECNLDVCAANTECDNLAGSYACSCIPDYVSSDPTSIDCVAEAFHPNEKIVGRLQECGILSEGMVRLFDVDSDDVELLECVAECFTATACDTLQTACTDVVERGFDALAGPVQQCANTCFGVYTCNDGEELPGSFACDGEDDCAGGEDEADCPAFVCEDGDSLPQAWVCDGDKDCAGGEDEVDCPGFQCDDGETIPETYVCDGGDDCAGGEDEVDCPNFTCENGNVIPLEWVCDSEADCSGGEDEAECPTFTCDDGQEVLEKVRCDLELDCNDGSDEVHGCAKILCTAE